MGQDQSSARGRKKNRKLADLHAPMMAPSTPAPPDALQQHRRDKFKALTLADDRAADTCLARNNWNVEEAIVDFFDHESEFQPPGGEEAKGVEEVAAQRQVDALWGNTTPAGGGDTKESELPWTALGEGGRHGRSRSDATAGAPSPAPADDVCDIFGLTDIPVPNPEPVAAPPSPPPPPGEEPSPSDEGLADHVEWEDDDDQLDAEGRNVRVLAQDAIPKVAVIGRTGVGKSTLLNQLVNGMGKEPAPFVTSCGGSAGTNKCAIKLRRFRGPRNICCAPGERPPKMVVVDVPGFSDPQGRDTGIMAQLVAVLKKLRTVSVFMLVMNAEDARLSKDKKAMLEHLVASCGKEALRNCIVVFTHWPRDKRSRKGRRKAAEGTHGAGFLKLDLSATDQRLQDDKRNELLAFCRKDLQMGQDFELECIFVDNMCDLDDVDDEEDQAEVDALRVQFGILKRKIFERAVGVDASPFNATRSLEDQLKHERQAAQQSQARAEQHAAKTQQRAAVAEQRAQRAQQARQQAQQAQQRADAEARREKAEREKAERLAREQRQRAQQAETARQQAQRLQRQAAEQARRQEAQRAAAELRMREAERRAQAARQQEQAARRQAQAVSAFVGVFVKLTVGRVASFPKQERLLKPTDKVSKVKELLAEGGHKSRNQLAELSLMFQNTAMQPGRTLASYGMRGGMEYDVVTIVERHGGMNREMKQYLARAAGKTITYQNSMEGVPSIRMCPSCKQLIRHVAACKHMTCTCGHQFCFACLRPWASCGYAKCRVAPRQS